jgi:hypothetical protein
MTGKNPNTKPVASNDQLFASYLRINSQKAGNPSKTMCARPMSQAMLAKKSDHGPCATKTMKMNGAAGTSEARNTQATTRCAVRI